MKRNTIQEMKEILEAIEHGKAIQFTYDGVNWNDTDKFINPYAPDFMHNKFRIKPEKKLRPFKDTKELIAYNDGLHILWLKDKTTGDLELVTMYASDYVKCQDYRYTMEELLKNYTFSDGTACGFEEDA